MELPWAERPKAILEAYLGGDAVGEAVVDILYGRENPSGRLPESFPMKLEDNPSYLFYPGEDGRVSYREGLFMGYRYYESKRMAVRYPFGYGLSYTGFRVSNLRLDRKIMGEGDTLSAQVTVTNCGNRTGKTVVQLYVAPEQGPVPYPTRELKCFEKVELAPGESCVLTFTLDSRSFAHWNPTVKEWRMDSGRYLVQIGDDVRDILLEQAVTVEAEPVPPTGGYSLNAPMSLFAKSPKGRAFLDQNAHLMIRGMAAAGYMPKELLPALEQLGPGPDLTALGAFFQSMGSADGMETLFEQPLSILDAFLPPDRKESLRGLLAALNQ